MAALGFKFQSTILWTRQSSFDQLVDQSCLDEPVMSNYAYILCNIPA